MATKRHNDAVSPRNEGRPDGSEERPVKPEGAAGGGTGSRREDGESFLDRIQVLLNGLVSFPRTLRLYPSHHQRTQKHAQRLARLVKRMLPSCGGSLELRVRADEVYANEILLDKPEQLLAEFALLLRARAVRALVFHRGVEANEFTAVGEWFAHVPEGSTATETQAVLNSISHPRLDIVLVGQSAQRSRVAGLVLPEGETRTDGLAIVVHDLLKQPSIARRLERMSAGSGGEVAGTSLPELLLGFFGRLDWTSLPPKVLEATVRGFLGRVAELGSDPDSDDAANTLSQAELESLLNESLDSALAVADAQDGLFQSSSLLFADASRDQIAYEKLDLAELERHGMPDRDTAHADLTARHEEHCPVSASLLIEAELLLAGGADKSAPRLTRLRRTLARRDLPADGVAAAISGLHAATPDHDDADWHGTVREIAAGLGSHEALAALLGLLAADRDAARLLAGSLARRRDAFDMLAGLMQLRLPLLMRELVVETLVKQARTGIESWATWCFENPRTVLNEYVCGVLLITAPDLLEPVARKLLGTGEKAETEHGREFLRLLAGNGGEPALQLILGGAAERKQGPGRSILDALGHFKHDLAIAALKDAVHGANSKRSGNDDVRRPLAALKRIGTPDALEFLEEVVKGKRGLFHRFRKELRQAARQVLDERWSPCDRR